MTATPIPRTLALTTYGDLDVSVMREMPPGRQPDQDDAKPESRRDEIYDFVREQIDAGRQVYVIYPLVEESEKVDLKAATEMADHSRRTLPGVPRRSPPWPDEDWTKKNASWPRSRAGSQPCRRRRSSRWAWTCRTPR